MALLEILKFPDPRLRKKAVPVKGVTPELKTLVSDMLETMYASRGIGLAAPQIGESIQLVVIDVRPQGEGGRYKIEDLTEKEQAVEYPLVLFNPKIVYSSGRTSFDEGCLSVPGYFETVKRAAEVKVEALDVNGKPITVETDGLLAVCIQHELDHLMGKLFIDRLSPIKSTRIKSRIKKHGYDKNEAEESAEDVAL